MKQLTDDLQDRVIELLVTSLHFTPSHEPNIAIDAQAAILELRALPDVPIAKPAPEVNSMLVEALKDTAQTLAWMQHGKCRGFSDGLLTTQEALDKAREALTAAKQAQPARPINCGTGHCSCIECPYEQAQPEPTSVYRLTKKEGGVWLPASEWLTGYPDPSWSELVKAHPELWSVQRRVTGKQIADGFAKAMGQQAQPERAPLYSLDTDSENIRARTVHAVLGAVALGANNENKPPSGHWLTEIWDIARAEREGAVDRVTTLFENCETPYLPDIARAIDGAAHGIKQGGQHD